MSREVDRSCAEGAFVSIKSLRIWVDLETGITLIPLPANELALTSFSGGISTDGSRRLITTHLSLS